MTCAIYFDNGSIAIRENGNQGAAPTNYTRGESCDFRIEIKPGAGARFFLRPSGVGAAFVKIFEDTERSNTEFSFGADVYAGAFGFDDFSVTEVYSALKEVSTPVFPGGTVTLEVVDHALQTNTASVVITPAIGGPPLAVISGPTNGQAGVEIPFEGYNSADDYAIASYTWDFGDGSQPAFGPAVAHRYSSVGTYTNTLTVADYAGFSSSASLVITITGAHALVCVPWRIVAGVEQPHEVYSGKTNTLKAVARGVTVPFTYVWEFGDDTGSITNEITSPVASGIYNLEAKHAYIGSDGTPLSATATVLLTNGTILTDTYPLVIRPKTLDPEMNVAIDEGLWYSHKTQNRYDIDANNKGGDWTSAGYKINATASAVLAFAINGHLMTDDAWQDPYVDTVQRGINYLLTALTTANIGPQTYGDPDGNHNGLGLTGDSSRPIYETGPLRDAFVAAARPEWVARVGGAKVRGRPFRDLMQDLVDLYCWGQYDHPGVGGGWRYGWNEHPDNSASQWAAIGLYAAEHFWDLPAPDWVKERNVVWVGYASYHQHPAYRVAEYRWDFNAADGLDCEHPDAIGPGVTNAYGAFSTNLVTLQVRDNASPQLNGTASVIVRTTIPPYPPTADAGGPYVAAVGEDIKLNGSGSFDVDEAHGDFIRAWDWEMDFAVPLDFDDGVTGRMATIVGGLPTAGQRSLALRVTDATSIVFPQLGSPDLTGEDFTTLFVYDRVTELQSRPKGNKIQLTWTKAGDYAVIQRSTLGPNRGFAEIGRTASDYSTFLDTNVQYNVEYFYRSFACQNGRADPLGVSDPEFVVSRQRGFEDHPPQFNSTPLRLAVVGQPYGVTLDANDPENDPFTFTLLAGPTNLTVNATNGFVDFTPTEEQGGSHFLSFDATNAAGRDVMSYPLFVFPASNSVPGANANGPYAALIGEDILFSSAGTGDADDDSLFITWSFGDGSTSTCSTHRRYSRPSRRCSSALAAITLTPPS